MPIYQMLFGNLKFSSSLSAAHVTYSKVLDKVDFPFTNLFDFGRSLHASQYNISL